MLEATKCLRATRKLSSFSSEKKVRNRKRRIKVVYLSENKAFSWSTPFNAFFPIIVIIIRCPEATFVELPIFRNH